MALLGHEDVNVNYADKKGWTALHFAVEVKKSMLKLIVA